MLKNATRLWVVHISNHARIATRAQRDGFICIGWTKMGDLSQLVTRELMKARMKETWPNWSPNKVGASFGQAFKFAHEMQPGDAVVYPVKASREVMIGEITGPYRFANDDAELVEYDYCNIRSVRWLKTVPRIAFSAAALYSFGSFTSVSRSDDHLEEVLAVLASEKGLEGPVVTGQVVPSKPAKRLPPDIDAGMEIPTEEEEVEPAAEVMESGNLAERAIEETKDYLIREWTRTGTEFEEVVAAVFRAMGYTATTQQGTHDLGVDVVAHPDPLGVQPPLLKIQCKSGTSTIGAPAVKQLRGLLNDREKGILVSLGGFSIDARHVQQNDADLVLIDADRFVGLFLDHYDRLAPEWRHRFPLTRVFVAVG